MFLTSSGAGTTIKRTSTQDFVATKKFQRLREGVTPAHQAKEDWHKKREAGTGSCLAKLSPPLRSPPTLPPLKSYQSRRTAVSWGPLRVRMSREGSKGASGVGGWGFSPAHVPSRRRKRRGEMGMSENTRGRGGKTGLHIGVNSVFCCQHRGLIHSDAGRPRPSLSLPHPSPVPDEKCS